MREFLRAYDRECREHVRVGDPAYRVERDGSVTRIVGPTDVAYENCVVWSKLDPSTADAEIVRQTDHFAGLAKAFEWKHFDHDVPRDLDRRLEASGFRRGEPETLMALDVAAAPVDRRPSIFDVRRIGADRLGELLGVQSAVSGQEYPWLEAGLRRELAHDASAISLYAAYANDVAVSIGWIRFGHRFATIHGGATLPAWRGKGAYDAILSRRLGEARSRGIQWLVSDSTEMSRPRLERRGFKAVGRTTPFVCTP
jgi:GNAT superfamily N-acetyltransferase